MLKKQFKKILLAIFGVSAAYAAITLPSTPEEALISKIAEVENTYYAENGKYLQILQTGIPTEGLNQQSYSKKPHYQSKDILSLGLPLNLPFTYEVNQFENWKGEKGYQILFYKMENGKKYSKAIGFGIDSTNLTTNSWKEIK